MGQPTRLRGRLALGGSHDISVARRTTLYHGRPTARSQINHGFDSQLGEAVVLLDNGAVGGVRVPVLSGNVPGTVWA